MPTTALEPDERRRRVARAAIVFALVAPISYVLLRLYEIARSGHVDPSLILRSTHVGYLWRVAIASWWALTCALSFYGLARGSGGRRAGARLLSPRRLGAIAILLAIVVVVVSFAYP